MLRLTVAATAALLFAGAAFAGTEMKFPVFTGINVHGGGHVTLRHGAVQRVTVLKGDLNKIDLHMNGSTLDISPCKDMCWGSNPLDVEIITPGVTNLEVHGGGDLDAAGDFPRQASLTVQVHGGGDLDGRAIPADTITAEVHGGGDARVHPLNALKAEVHGGGDLSYIGNPPRIETSTHGGGSVHKE